MDDNVDLKQASRNANPRLLSRRWSWIIGIASFAVLALVSMIERPTVRFLKAGVAPLPETLGILIQILCLLDLAGVLLISFLAMVGVIAYNSWRGADDSEEAAQVIPSIVPDLPVDSSSQRMSAGGTIFLRVSITLALMIVGFLAIHIVFSLFESGPYWASMAIPISILPAGGVAIVRLYNTIRRGWAGTKRTPYQRLVDVLRELGVSILMFGMAALSVTLILWLVAMLLPRLSQPVFMMIAGLVGFVLVVGISLIFMLIPVYWLLPPVGRTDYKTGLTRARTMQRFAPLNLHYYLIAEYEILKYAGRWQAAEEIIKQAISLGQRQKAPPANQALALQGYGAVLLAEGRYDEAQRVLESSIQLRPEGSGSYLRLAELYLKQGINGERALELANKAIENKGKSLLLRLAARWNWAEFYSIRAWALAACDRHAEAEAEFERAFKIAGNFKPELAMAHYRAARATDLRGDSAAVSEHLGRAVALDPHGAAGHLASQGIKQNISVSA